MNEKTDLRSVSAEQRATLTRIRSLLKRAETWPMHGDDNLRQWIDEMRYLVPLLLDRIAAAEAETARVRACVQQFLDWFSPFVPRKHTSLGKLLDSAATLARTEEQR